MTRQHKETKQLQNMGCPIKITDTVSSTSQYLLSGQRKKRESYFTRKLKENKDKDTLTSFSMYPLD